MSRNAASITRISASVSVHNPAGFGDALQLQAVATEGSRYGRLAYTLPVGLQGVRMGLHASDMRYKLVRNTFSPSCTTTKLIGYLAA